MMSPDELAFFPPRALPLYEALREALLTLCPQTDFAVSRTQISLRCGRVYGCVSLPRRKSDRDAGALLLTIGLPWQLSDARILAASQPYPGRWTHHLLIRSAEELDAQLLAWLREAAAFAGRK